MGHLDVLQGDHHEGGLRQLDQALGRRLDVDVAAERHPVETKIPDGHVDLQVLAASGFGDLLGKRLEEAIELGAAAALLLLGLELILVAVPVLALPIARLVELDGGSLSVELDILRLHLVANDYGVLEMDVDDDDELVLAGLEEQMADVGEENIDSLLRVQGRLIPDTVGMDLDLAGHALTLHGGTHKDIIQHLRPPI